MNIALSPEWEGSPPHAMERALAAVDRQFGSVTAYLASPAVGFGPEWQQRLSLALLERT